MADSREQIMDILTDKAGKMVLNIRAVNTGMPRPSNMNFSPGYEK